MYTIEFEDTEEGRKRYEVCTQSLILTSRQTAVSEWDEVVDLLKALKGAGVKTKQQVGGKFLYDLKDGGAIVLLEKAEHKLLVDFVKQPMWVPEGVEAARETVKWLEALEYKRGSKKSDARPEDKRAAEAETTEAAKLERKLKLLKEQAEQSDNDA